MNVYLIAPRTDLFYADAEVQAILRSGLQVTPRLGDVRHVDVLSDIDASAYDVLWFAGHATPDGLLLTDSPLPADELAPMIRGRFTLVVLNTCDSMATAQALQNETEATVIATVLDAPDRLSFSTGALFARELARSGDIPTAYNAAKPGNNRTYIYLAGGKRVVHDVYSTINERLDRLEAALRSSQHNLARIVALMDGDPAWRITGIPDQLAAYIKSNEDWKDATKNRIILHDSRLAVIENRNRILARPIALAIVGVLCLIVSALFFMWLFFSRIG